jgi:ABC-type glycerol-3-phosphate transport system permease component
VFWRILFPLVAPGLVATSIFSCITAWNEFIFALTFLGNDGGAGHGPLAAAGWRRQHPGAARSSPWAALGTAG